MKKLIYAYWSLGLVLGDQFRLSYLVELIKQASINVCWRMSEIDMCSWEMLCLAIVCGFGIRFAQVASCNCQNITKNYF